MCDKQIHIIPLLILHMGILVFCLDGVPYDGVATEKVVCPIFSLLATYGIVFAIILCIAFNIYILQRKKVRFI